MTEHYRELIVAARRHRQGVEDYENEKYLKMCHRELTHPIYTGQRIDFNSWLAGILFVDAVEQGGVLSKEQILGGGSNLDLF